LESLRNGLLSGQVEKLKKIRKARCRRRSEPGDLNPGWEIGAAQAELEIALTEIQPRTTFPPGWAIAQLHRKGGDARSATLKREINTAQRPFNPTPGNQA